jgi:hypothetical protein
MMIKHCELVETIKEIYIVALFKIVSHLRLQQIPTSAEMRFARGVEVCSRLERISITDTRTELETPAYYKKEETHSMVYRNQSTIDIAKILT